MGLWSARRALPARYLMAVAPFARLVQDTTIDREQVVLDIGCSCGYSSAALSLLSSSAIALEEDGELMTFATRSLSHAQAQNIAFVTGPPKCGVDRCGAFLIEGSADRVPAIYTRSGSALGRRCTFNAAVPPLPGFEAPKAFAF